MSRLEVWLNSSTLHLNSHLKQGEMSIEIIMGTERYHESSNEDKSGMYLCLYTIYVNCIFFLMTHYFITYQLPHNKDAWQIYCTIL